MNTLFDCIQVDYLLLNTSGKMIINIQYENNFNNIEALQESGRIEMIWKSMESCVE